MASSPSSKSFAPLAGKGLTTAVPLSVTSPTKKWALIGAGAVVAIGLAAAARPWLQGPADPMATERPAIEASMGQYRSAYRNKNLAGIATVFPTLPADTRLAMQKDFANCLVYEVTFEGMQVTLDTADPNRAQVDVRSTHTCTPSSGGRQIDRPRHELFELRKNGDAWLIDRSAPSSAGGPQ